MSLTFVNFEDLNNQPSEPRKMNFNPKMKKLGSRNYTLIKRGVKTFGTFDPEEIICYFEEELYVDQYDNIYMFLAWVFEKQDERGYNSDTYELKYAEWYNTKII